MDSLLNPIIKRILSSPRFDYFRIEPSFTISSNKELEIWARDFTSLSSTLLDKTIEVTKIQYFGNNPVLNIQEFFEGLPYHYSLTRDSSHPGELFLLLPYAPSSNFQVREEKIGNLFSLLNRNSQGFVSLMSL